MSSLARRVGCTEGQLYTIVIGFVVAVALLAIGIPPVLRDEPLAAAPATPAASPVERALEPVVTTTVDPPASPVVASAPVASTPPTADRRPESPPVASPASPTAAPRSVVDAGYTSATSGTPLSGPEVPEDGMPVGVRLGQVDKMSFARLAGTAPVLRLALVDDAAANQLVAFAAVRACAITEVGWTLSGPGAPPSEAPAFDSGRCVDGEADADGTWRFDLGAIGAIDDRAGIALVPVSEGPSTFQVTFSTVAVPA